MATIEDVKVAAEAAKRERENVKAPLLRVKAATSKSWALEPKNAAVTAAAEARRQSIEAWTAAMDVNTAEASYFATGARAAAADAETDAMQAVDVYNTKPD